MINTSSQPIMEIPHNYDHMRMVNIYDPIYLRTRSRYEIERFRGHPDFHNLTEQWDRIRHDEEYRRRMDVPPYEEQIMRPKKFVPKQNKKLLLTGVS